MINIVCVGKIKEKALTTLLNEYLKRIAPYSKIEVLEVKDEPNDKLPQDKIKEIEGVRILKQIKDDDFVILLDLQGQYVSSEQLASKITEINTYKSSNIDFVIGGSLGVSQEVRNRANFRLKISDMTFPHNLVRLIILEQIYRAYKIMNNETYHK